MAIEDDDKLIPHKKYMGLTDVDTNRRRKGKWVKDLQLVSIVDRINRYLSKDGTLFRAESLHGAEITLHIDLNGYLVLSVTEDAGESRTWEMS